MLFQTTKNGALTRFFLFKESAHFGFISIREDFFMQESACLTKGKLKSPLLKKMSSVFSDVVLDSKTNSPIAEVHTAWLERLAELIPCKYISSCILKIQPRTPVIQPEQEQPDISILHYSIAGAGFKIETGGEPICDLVATAETTKAQTFYKAAFAAKPGKHEACLSAYFKKIDQISSRPMSGTIYISTDDPELAVVSADVYQAIRETGSDTLKHLLYSLTNPKAYSLFVQAVAETGKTRPLFSEKYEFLIFMPYRQHRKNRPLKAHIETVEEEDSI
ncbi:hypothetical protein P5U49_000158 [Neisseria gonorrhoeae]